METDMATEPPPANLPELIQTLNQALESAKQISSGNPKYQRLILSSLTSAQLALSSLHRDSDETMMTEDGNGEEEEDTSMEKVEEKMRESLSIRNKRRKRTLSPSTDAGDELRQGLDDDVRVPAPDYDPYRTRVRNLELVYQFHA